MNDAFRFERLRPNDRVAVVSPSGAVEREPLARGIEWLRGRYGVADDDRREAADGFLAGSDAQRASALIEALEDRSVRAIFASRGGYGAMRVLECLGTRAEEALRRDPKPIVGFSDITALHALWARERVVSVHAPMVAAIGRSSVRAADRDALVDLVETGRIPPWRDMHVAVAGDATGRIAGGNLAIVTSLLGTRYAVSFDGAIAFFEDVGERPYRVDRMLTQLRLAGAFRGVRAIVLGDFTDCAAGPDGRTVEYVLRERLGDLGVPLYLNAPFGHAERQAPFACGGIARIESGIVHFEPI